MSKENEMKQKYLKEADLMATKPRYGFFNIYPSHTAGITDYAQKTAHKDESGKVLTKERGVFSGCKSTKVLSKTCFSEIKSPFVSCPYQDPGKMARIEKMKEKKKWEHKQIFKPARLQKSLISSSYKYNCVKPEDKARKFRDENGRVVTGSANICSSPLSNLVYKRVIRNQKYMEDPYENLKIKNKEELDLDLSRRGQYFKLGNPVKDYFNNNRIIFDDTTNLQSQVDKSGKTFKRSKTLLMSKVAHEGAFRPSSGKSTKNNGLFNQVTYEEEREVKKRPQTAMSQNSQNTEIFKSSTKVYNSRPCPSVTLSRLNLMRKVR